MTRVELTRAAEADLLDVWLYIASDDSAAADHQLEHFSRVFELLTTQPLMGMDRSALLQSGVRSFAVDHYLVFYRADETITVLRVLHGARDWIALLDDASY